MRTLAITAAAVLVTAGSVAQRAIEAPRPSGTPKNKSGVVEQVACASAKSCAAYGGWLYTEQAGMWKAAKVPVLAHTSSTTLRSLACPASGHCEAVGYGGEQHAVRLAQSGGHWNIAEIALPGDAAPINPPSGPYPGVTLACAAAGNCAAVGHYFATDHTTRPLLATESNGTWGAGTEVSLPPDASTQFPPPDGPSFSGGFLSYASCPSTGSCTTVGSYIRGNGSGGILGAYPWDFDKAGGLWGGGVALQLPSGAATKIDSRAGGGSPFMGFSGLSCPSAGNCTAVGGYVDSHSDFQGAIFTERGGTWSKATKAPVPASAGHNTDAMELLNPLTAVSCAAPGDCAAVGFWVTDTDTGSSETPHGLLLAEHSGKWKASAISLPAGAKASGGVYLTSVACPSKGDCVAVGYYAEHGKTHGLVVRERGGKWQRATNVALPKGAAPASKAHTFLNSVSCPSKTACTAGGYYSDSSGHIQGLLLNLRLG